MLLNGEFKYELRESCKLGGSGGNVLILIQSWPTLFIQY
jgi:hypothetical protein